MVSQTEPAADRGILRRIWVVMWAYLAVGASASLLLASWRAALVLTLAAAATMVSFRGLEALVGRLDARPGGGPGFGFVLGLILRLLLLGAALVAILQIGPDERLAVVLGVSVLPAALMAEAAWQLLRLLTHGD